MDENEKSRSDPAPEEEVSLEGRDILFGRIALRKGYVLLPDLEDSLYLQEREPQRGRIGEILVSRGLLSTERREEILGEIRERVSRKGTGGKPVGDVLFGRLAVRKGILPEEEINAALREQENRREEGKPRRLGAILVDRGRLTCAQVERILNFQGKEIMKCDACGKHFNVLGLLRSAPCPECTKPLRLPLDIPPAEVHGDVG